MAKPEVQRWTLADLDVFLDDGGWTRYEIVDGELLVSEVPDNLHQEVTTLATFELGNWNCQTMLGTTLVFPHLIFDDENNTIPDVVWVSDARRHALEQADDKLHGAPELVVEVLSPGPENERRDREAKLGLYARRGVVEYWVLDPATRTVSVYRRMGDDLALTATLDPAATLTAPVLPGFSARVAHLFPEV
jgi:Uma2 family endonuclease